MAENALRRGALPRNFLKERLELEKLIEEADKKNEELDKELQELDDRDKDKQVLCDEQQRTKQWIEDVRKAMSEGAPISGKPEEIDIAYPSLEIRKKIPEEAPNEEAPTSRHHPQGHLDKTPWKRRSLITRCPQKTRTQTLSPWRKQCHNCVGPRKMRGPQSPWSQSL